MESTVSLLIQAANDGEEFASNALFTALYSELHRIAKREIVRQGRAVTLGATTLLHEAYIEIAGKDAASFYHWKTKLPNGEFRPGGGRKKSARVVRTWTSDREAAARQRYRLEAAVRCHRKLRSTMARNGGFGRSVHIHLRRGDDHNEHLAVSFLTSSQLIDMGTPSRAAPDVSTGKPGGKAIVLINAS